jgi:DNA-binding NarL/FixJ family response regulator
VDTRERLAVQELARQAVVADLDHLAAEVAALSRTVSRLERSCGLATSRLPPDDRREQVTELRERGLSTRTIAALVGTHRTTVQADVRQLGLPAPATTLGADGVVRRTRQ